MSFSYAILISLAIILLLPVLWFAILTLYYSCRIAVLRIKIMRNEIRIKHIQKKQNKIQKIIEQKQIYIEKLSKDLNYEADKS